METLDDESRDSIYLLIMDLEDSFFEDGLHDRIASQEFENLFVQYETFITEASAKSKTFAYWSMYLKLIGKFNELS